MVTACCTMRQTTADVKVVAQVTLADGLDDRGAGGCSGSAVLQEERDWDLPLPLAIDRILRPG